MKHSCEAPVHAETLVDYLADDLAEPAAAAVEETLFRCAACQARADGLAAIVRALRAMIPSVISTEQLSALRAAGLVVAENPCLPGVRREAAFAPHVEILVHRLGGLDLADAERVELRVGVESTGQVMVEDPFAPFDRDRGELLIACQRHFADLPPDVVFDVRVIPRGGEPPAPEVRYLVPHVYQRG